ncbi:hypothetical protein [Nonomuraea basaltis]|uniref:hypothetical protein n=1 Tax=Nonomuraea basaltis TaxID=2495887 RepID=UPI00110C49D0|nr:hypothetical protein [Nonomuraea basaltis]TMR88135.1 hypothetical protein EJK15_67900 [Nonomuraea basaltis]
MKTRNLLVAAATAAAAAALWALPATLTGIEAGDGGRRFTTCMRAQGLPDFPDVAVSSDGLVNLTIGSERVEVLSEKYGEAVRACRHLLPAGAVLPGGPLAPQAPMVRFPG